eukprot:TRINITY_DN4509_c0_g1_i1.p1 TRINITY_DN4509_c0_g1~~TRINITY_DN4509_c0_g1_i1.p1  ORF type:complete len:209 (-),score=47.71 TRINITY_DN4509_c0_g1_i1:36-662(-)
MFRRQRKPSNITVEEVPLNERQSSSSRQPVIEQNVPHQNRFRENPRRDRFSLLNRDDPFDDPFFRDPFTMRNSLFEDVQRQFEEIEERIQNPPNRSNMPDNTVSYSSMTTSFTGPNGVTHQEHRSYNSSAGTQVHQVRRGIGNRTHDFESITDSTGHERTTSRYNNIQEDEVDLFEQEFSNQISDQPRWMFGSSNANMLRGLPSGHQQ